MTDASKKIQDFLKGTTPSGSGKPAGGIIFMETAPVTNTVEPPKIDKLKKTRQQNGGKRPGSGRKTQEQTIKDRGIKAIMDAHANESVKIRITDPKTGQTIEIDKPRALILLEDLFLKAHNDKEVQAIKEWFDRAVGKAPQTIKGDEDEPIRILID